jgi:DNA-binding XRE family transcriptional regulator
MKTKSKDIIVLLGAGASVEAGIPASAKMIDEIERLLVTEEWKGFKDLYHHIKAAIHYAAGIKGRFKDNVSYNIETLVNTLYELERNEDHPIYPFVAAWNSRMMAYAGADFGEVCKFRKQILRALKGWVQLESPDKASYYSGLRELQRALQFPLKVFSLNYDLCVEGLTAHDFRVETGFSGVGESHRWEWKRFDETDPEVELPEIYLYKMHGSINWKRDDTGNLIWVNHTDNILPDKMQVIFGRDFKLDAADPYLFYAFEFRRCSLEARTILVVGYGFSDEHINKMLSQAVRHDSTKRLIVIGNVRDKAGAQHRQQEIATKLGVHVQTVVIIEGTAKEFLARNDLASEISKYVPEESKVEF